MMFSGRLRFGLSLLFLLASTGIAFSQQEARPDQNSRPSEKEQVAAARKILDTWHAENPQPGERVLRIVCWTPDDRELPANYQARLTRIMLHIQNFYADEMERLGFGRRSVNLEMQKDGQLKVYVVKGRSPRSKYAKQSGRQIREECREPLKEQGLDIDQETIVLFCNLADWDAERLRFKHNSPYYANGSNRSGTAWQLDSPELDTTNLTKKQPMIFDGEYGRISLGKHNSIFIGGIAHELGHGLGLPHNLQRPDEAVRGTALMGSGNRSYGDELRGEGRGSFLTLAHALRLASHPQFSGSVKGMQQRATSRIDELQIRSDGKRIQVSGKVSGSLPVYGIVAYIDPDGGGDYDATTETIVPAADGTFTLDCGVYFRGKPGELRLVVLHVNGDTTKRDTNRSYRFGFDVDRDGTIQLEDLAAQLELAPFVEALVSGKMQQATRIASSLKSQKAKEIAKTLLSRPVRNPDASTIPESTESIPLTRTGVTSARVGWGRVVYDRLPYRPLLLVSGGKLFSTGIYAHAPANHTWKTGGKWNRVTGHVGIADGHRGSVQFSIKGDGKTLWTSQVIRSGRPVTFDVNTEGVTTLELITSPTPDGPASDWGLWLEPMLHRK